MYIYIYIKKQSPSLRQSQTHLPDCQTNKRGTSLHRNCFYCSRLQWRHALHHFTSMTLGIALGDVKLTSSCFHEAPATQFCADFNGSGRLELWNQQSVSVFYAPCASAIGDGELLLFLNASTFTWEWMNEWMMHLYIALLCIAVHPKCFYNHVGGVSPQPPSMCSIHLDERQPRQCAHHTTATGGEERES